MSTNYGGSESGKLIRCPDCGGAVCKYGKTNQGAQRYRCLDSGCRRQFDPEAKKKKISPTVTAIVAGLIAQGVSTTKIHTAVAVVSKRWINKQRQASLEKDLDGE